jgi:lambda repressor-like predicted transcriptional regulator
MTPAGIVATLRERGARLEVLPDDRLAVTPRSALDDDLRAAIRSHKAAIVAELRRAGTDPATAAPKAERPPSPSVNHGQVYAGLTAADTVDDLAAIEGHVRRNGRWVGDEIVWLDRRCAELAQAGADETVFRAAVVLLVARVDELRRWHEGTPPVPAPRRLVIERNAPVTGPVQLRDGTTVEHVGRFVARLLTAADYAVARRGLDAVLDVYLEQLATLGVVVAVEWVQ